MAPGLRCCGGHQALLWVWGPPRWRADPPPPARRSRATLGWRVGPSAGGDGQDCSQSRSRRKCSDRNLLASLADQVALADQDLVGVPRERLALGAVAPAHDRAARAPRPEREILKAHDLHHGWTGVPGAHLVEPTRGFTSNRSGHW